MKTNRLLITLVLLGVLLLASCRSRFRVGDLQTKSQTVERGDADSVNVKIQTGADELDVPGGASELLEASFTYNVKELNPRATYANGRLVVKDSAVSIGIASLADLAEYRSKWDLKLNEIVPMAASGISIWTSSNY
jgi:hypothetical protein